MVEPSAPLPSPPSVPATTATICPYLLADGGAWRASSATRAHRCAAVTPPAILAADKQRRLCLTVDHGSCATYTAARALRAVPERHGAARPERPTARSFARTTPLVLDHGRLAFSAPTRGMRLDRSLGQAALVVLMVLAFAVILVSRLTGGGPAAGVAGATGTPGPSASVTDPSREPGSSAEATTPAPTDDTTPVPTDGSTPAPSETDGSASPAPSSVPSAGASTYVIKPGDTLSDIAAEHGTTWQALAELNGIDDPGALRVGQEIQLP